MDYCAIIGDIVNSKKIKNRREVQEKFREVLTDINNQYTNLIASNFTITLGDEFQGLLYSPSHSYDIIKLIKSEMKPVKLVFGVGIGEMRTGFQKEIAIGSDGPAYHYARLMVERAKKKKPSICYHSHSPEDELINALVYFIESVTQNRTKNQLEVVKMYEEVKSQYLVAGLTGIRQSTVSAVLAKALYYEVQNAEERIQEFLSSKFPWHLSNTFSGINNRPGNQS